MSNEQVVPEYTLAQKLVAEAVGTYALVVVGTGAIVANVASNGAVTHAGIAISFGLIVATMIYALGHVSSCHINPAVTIGFCFAKKFPWSMALPYIAVQCVAAAAGSASVLAMFGQHGNLGSTVPAEFAGVSGAFFLELFMTGLLMFVILQVAKEGVVAETTAGAVIGSVVGFEAMFGGPASGASMNPARSLGPAIMSGTWDAHWIYWTAPVLGALIAVFFHSILCPNRSESA